MTTAPLSSPQPAGVPVTRWSTPRTLRALMIAVYASAALLLLVGETLLGVARGSVKTLGHDSAPSIMAAQEISASLADLDANTANYMLGSFVQRVTAEEQVELRRVAATEELVHAAENITYGDVERVPIQRMLDGLGRYLELAAQARLLHDGGDVPGAKGRYREATALMHGSILPAANALDEANRTKLDEAYARQQSMAGGAEAIAGILGLGFLGLLAGTQWFLFNRMRRILNPALLVATLLALGFTVSVIDTLGSARADLRVAKEDAFDSIHFLYRARAAAYDGNGDESRYLFDRERAADHEAAFNARVRELTDRPDLGAADLERTAKGAFKFGGYLGKELANITFVGERDAALETARNFGAYYAIDKRIRALELSGNHTGAVSLCIGYGANDSNEVFGRFDAALGRTIDINHRMFDQKVAHAEGRLGAAEIVDPVLALAIAVLAWLGLRPRLREYPV